MHQSFIISSTAAAAAALLLSYASPPHPPTPPDPPTIQRAGLGQGGRSYIIDVKVSFKQDSSAPCSLHPCPVSPPGHALLLECGHKPLVWGAGFGGLGLGGADWLARNERRCQRQRCDPATGRSDQRPIPKPPVRGGPSGPAAAVVVKSPYKELLLTPGKEGDGMLAEESRKSEEERSVG